MDDNLNNSNQANKPNQANKSTVNIPTPFNTTPTNTTPTNTTYKKPSLFKPDGDPNQTVDGFNFNRNDFEDLIDNFTPFDDIPVLLGISRPQMDQFCIEIYRMDFKTTYDSLLKRSELYYRKAMLTLSKSGNPSAIKVATEFYVGLGKLSENDNHITFIGAMPQSDSDQEKLAKKQQDKQQEAIKMINEEFKK